MKKMNKTKIFSLIITLALILSSLGIFTVSAAPTESEKRISFNTHSSGDRISGSIEHVFSGVDSEDDSPYGKYYYSDGYFTADSTSYNSHLATMSLISSVSSFTGLTTPDEYCYWRMEKFLSDIGFGEFESNAKTDHPPTPDTIGVVAAKKTVIDDGEPYTLVTITVRGGGYYSEWASNFVVGSADERGGNHKGFYEARDRALLFITDYITRNTEGKTKLWINGFSRGGAVAGLIGAWFNDNIPTISRFGISLTREDIFTYTFEAPATTDRKNLERKNYNNIFNTVSENDFVPRLPFSGNEENGWNFERPGVYVPYGKINNSDIERLNVILKTLDPQSNYDMDNFTSIMSALGNTQSKFLDKFIESAANRMSRDTYVTKIEKPLVEIMAKLMGMHGDESDAVIGKFIGGVCIDLAITDGIDLNTVLRLLNAISDDGEIEKIVAIIGKNLERSGLVEKYDEDVREFLIALTDFVFRGDENDIKMVFFIFNIITNNSTHEYDDKQITENRILSAHTPQMIVATQMLFDRYYTTPPAGFGGVYGERRDNVIEITVDVNGKMYTAYYYNGDTVTVRADVYGCSAIDGWYIGDEALSSSDICTFSAKEDLILEFKTIEKHLRITDWITDLFPTEEREGSKYKVCAECGSVIERVKIDKLFSVETIDVEENESGLPTAVLVSMGSVALILTLSTVLTLILRRRKSK